VTSCRNDHVHLDRGTAKFRHQAALFIYRYLGNSQLYKNVQVTRQMALWQFDNRKVSMQSTALADTLQEANGFNF